MAIPSKMQDRCNAIAVPGSTSSIRLVIQAFVVFFLISFLDVLLRHRGVDFGQIAPHKNPVDGEVLSLNPEKFTHTKQVLAHMGIRGMLSSAESAQTAEPLSRLRAAHCFTGISPAQSSPRET